MANFAPAAHNGTSPFADMRGHHVAVRAPDYEIAKRWYVEKLDFRVMAEWDYGDQKLAFVAPATDDHFHVEILGGGQPVPQEARPYADFGGSLTYAGYHHFCLEVASIEQTIASLNARDVPIVAGPFVVDVIRRRIAFFSDPFGNLIEIAEVLA